MKVPRALAGSELARAMEQHLATRALADDTPASMTKAEEAELVALLREFELLHLFEEPDFSTTASYDPAVVGALNVTEEGKRTGGRPRRRRPHARISRPRGPPLAL